MAFSRAWGCVTELVFFFVLFKEVAVYRLDFCTYFCSEVQHTYQQVLKDISASQIVGTQRKSVLTELISQDLNKVFQLKQQLATGAYGKCEFFTGIRSRFLQFILKYLEPVVARFVTRSCMHQTYKTLSTLLTP